MNIGYSKKFSKQFAKAPKKIQCAFKERLMIFMKNKFDSLLNNHQLTNEYSEYRSINITGDWRAIYENIDDETVYFMYLATHSSLYG